MAEEGTIMKSKPVDDDLNAETRALFDALHRATGEFAMFGHQNETSNVIGEHTDSDVHAVTGSYPAVWGNDLGGVELDRNRNLDGFGAEAIRNEMLRAFNMGAVNTLSWHSANPLTLGGYGHNMAEGTVKAVLPGGEAHEKFLGWLDRIAAALTTVTDTNGEPIPIVFRPFHEHTGDWFWWCTGSPARPTDTTPEQFVELWRMTIEYLRDVKHVHNVLYAYSPDRSRIDMSTPESLETGYLYAYPGDDYVDVLGFDDYWDIAPAEKSAEDPQARSAASWPRPRKSVLREYSPTRTSATPTISPSSAPMMTLRPKMAQRCRIRHGRSICWPPRSPTNTLAAHCGTCRGAMIRMPPALEHTARPLPVRGMPMISDDSSVTTSCVSPTPFRLCIGERFAV